MLTESSDIMTTETKTRPFLQFMTFFYTIFVTGFLALVLIRYKILLKIFQISVIFVYFPIGVFKNNGVREITIKTALRVNNPFKNRVHNYIYLHFFFYFLFVLFYKLEKKVKNKSIALRHSFIVAEITKTF